MRSCGLRIAGGPAPARAFLGPAAGLCPLSSPRHAARPGLHRQHGEAAGLPPLPLALTLGRSRGTSRGVQREPRETAGPGMRAGLALIAAHAASQPESGEMTATASTCPQAARAGARRFLTVPALPLLPAGSGLRLRGSPCSPGIRAGRAPGAEAQGLSSPHSPRWKQAFNDEKFAVKAFPGR